MWGWDTGPRYNAIILVVETRMGYGAEIAERDADVECRTWMLDRDAGNWTEIWERRRGGGRGQLLSRAEQILFKSNERATSNNNRDEL